VTDAAIADARVINVRLDWRSQWVAATHALKRSAGVS
jgi:hypothetical protein